jgi:hypothetical protein
MAEGGNDPFGEPAPAEPAPAEPAPADDLFGEPAKEPAAEPAPAEDDLFGAEKPAEEAAPVEPMADEPAPADDLFGAEPAAEPAPAADEPAPAAEEPAMDDLFNGDAKPDAAPEAPAKEPDLDDLFGKPVSTDKPANDDDAFFESLFGASAEKNQPAKEIAKPVQSDREEAKPADSDSTKELDDLFGVGANSQPAPFNGAEFRQWVDNTGAYQVKARLAVIYGDKVKLLKENGNYTTVTLGRLSESDFQYVQWVASSLTADTTSKLVKKDDSKQDADMTR